MDPTERILLLEAQFGPRMTAALLGIDHADVVRIARNPQAETPAFGEVQLDAAIAALGAKAPTFPLPLMDLIGHSHAGGGSAGQGRGAYGTVMRNLGRALGVRQFRDLAQGGTYACWPSLTLPGESGWGWVIGGQAVHGVPAGQPGLKPPYAPTRHAGVVWVTQNDLSILGRSKPRPMQEALRSIISWALTAAFADVEDPAWSYSAGWTSGALGGIASGPGAFYRVTTVPGSTATLTLPAETAGDDEFPGAPHVVCVDLFVDPDHDMTVGVDIDGVAQPDVRLQGSAICDLESGPNRFNTGYAALRRIVAGDAHDRADT